MQMPQPDIVTQSPSSDTPQKSPVHLKKPMFGAVLLMVMLIVAGIFTWQWYSRSNNTQGSPQSTSAEQDGATFVSDPGEKFQKSAGGIPVPVGSCTTGESVALGINSTITFKGVTTLKNEPFCTMQLNATGPSGIAAYDCAFKITSDTIYLEVDESGADRAFIRQHCRL